MIEIKNLSKQYIKDFYTLFDINLKIENNTLFIDKDFGAVCLFRLLSKIDKPTSGNIVFDDKDLKSIKDKNLNLAYLPSEPVLFKNKSVYKNLIYPLITRKFDKNKAKILVLDAINTYNLQNLPKKIKEASLSEQKIIALLRAVLHEPKYLLLENFYENLDDDYCIIANKILGSLPNTTIVLACEKTSCDYYKNFNIVNLELGNVKNKRV